MDDYYIKNEAVSKDLQRYAKKYYKEVQMRKQQMKYKEVENIKNDSLDALLGI